MVTIKEKLIQAFKIDPKLSLKHALATIEGLKKSNYYKIKHQVFPPDKSGKVDKKSKPTNNGRRASTGAVKSDQSLPTVDPECIGMTSVELIKYQLNKLMMAPNPELKVIETFIRYTKEKGDFEQAKPEVEEELGFRLQDRVIEELVETALDGQLQKSLLRDEQEEFSSHSDSSFD